MNFIDPAQFKTLQDVVEFAEKQQRTIIMLEANKKEMEDKIKHLELLLDGVKVTSLTPENKEIDICQIEINRLYQKCLNVPLEDKEVRNLEILVKTLAIARGKNLEQVKEQDKANNKATKSLPTVKLVELAKMSGNG